MMEEQNLDEHEQDLREAHGDAIDLDAEDPQDARVAELERQLEEARQKTLYAQAETQNVRRRLEGEKQTASAYAVTAFARDVLSVKDNLDRALSVIPEEFRQHESMKGLIVGIEATGRELTNVFQRHGITKVEALGQQLDPNRHQAMLEVPSDEPPGTIVQEMQAGYMIKDRLLRPALVGVARSG
jgi:molecular chaperone GrpE